jgi:hypothetical protein
MHTENLREDKTCLNCNHVVEKIYCPNCGQENFETKKSFHHLLTHFVEDLVHYDGAFWKTIKTLLWRPGKLTREYLAGKRKRYVPPVKLYIFINFLAFFLLTMLPSSNGEPDIDLNDKQAEKLAEQAMKGKTVTTEGGLTLGYKTMRELDSAQAAKPMNPVVYWVQRKLTETNESTTTEEFTEKFSEGFMHNLPKTLFLYMPVFAFFLWLFHGKKRWYYFDHGIFTLHYFSFLLLTFSLFLVVNSITDIIDYYLNIIVAVPCFVGLMGWWFFYFFRSHRKVYGEKKAISRAKGFALFVINLFLIAAFMLGLLLYSATNIH